MLNYLFVNLVNSLIMIYISISPVFLVYIVKYVYKFIAKRDFISYSKGMQLILNLKYSLILINALGVLMFLVLISVDIYYKEFGNNSVKLNTDNVDFEIFVILLVYVLFYIIKDLITNIKNL